MSTEESTLSPLQRAVLTVRTLRSRLETVTNAPIAIIGMGCRFPGAVDDVATYWSRLRTGFDAVTEIPPERWNVAECYDPDPTVPGRTYVRHIAPIADIDKFDAQFFNMSQREAN